MGQRFSFLIFLICCCALPVNAEVRPVASDTEQNAEALEMVASRMKSLTQSLNGLPQPPSFDKKIQLPDNLLPVPKTQTVPDEDLKEKKETA